MDLDRLVIRVMRPDEFDAVCRLCVAAFADDQRLARLLIALRESWAWIDDLSFVADLDGALVGHVLYTHAYVDAPARLIDVLVLSPVGVRPDLQRRGIGHRLITETLRVLETRNEPLVFLEGHPDYYPRFGFCRAMALGFTPPSTRIPDAGFMVRPLPRYEPSITGALVYPDAFWRNDGVGHYEG